MKKHNKLLLTVAVGVSISSTLEAGKVTAINKISDKPVYIFIRGEGADSYSTEMIKAGGSIDLNIENAHVSGKPTFEVIASTEKDGDIDWKMLGGKCGELVTVNDHTIVIDSTAGKVSCTKK